MGARTKFRHDKSLSLVDLRIDFPHDNHLKEACLVLPGDYYTEWTTEKNFIEKPKSARVGNSIELLSGKGCQHWNLINKNKPVHIGVICMHQQLIMKFTLWHIYAISPEC